jgi:hypothetical protein
MTPKLAESLDKQVIIKPAGLQRPVKCTLIGLEETGIWAASKELVEQLRKDSGQALLPPGYPKVFVPYARLDWLVLSTEE